MTTTPSHLKLAVDALPNDSLNDLVRTNITQASEWANTLLYGQVSGRRGDRGDRHRHVDADEFLYTILGEAEFDIEGEIVVCRAGDLLIVGAGKYHPVHVTGEEWKAVSAIVPRHGMGARR